MSCILQCHILDFNSDAFDEYVEPGDVIVVPESLRSRMFGNISILQTATAIATLWLTYKAAIGG